MKTGKNINMARNKSNLDTDWRQLGYRTKKLRLLAQDTANLAQHLMPLKDYRYLEKALRALQRFSSDAEDAMYRRGGPRDLDIFYGGQPLNDEAAYCDLRRSILHEVASWIRQKAITNKNGNNAIANITFADTLDIECGILEVKEG